MERTITKEDYVRFLDVLNALSKHCMDCEVRNGRIRVRSNNRLALYDITLPESWSDTSLPLSVIKSFLEIAKLFVPEGDEDQVVLQQMDKFLTLRDTYSVIRISLADPRQLNNRYVTDEEIKRAGIDENQEIASFEIDNIILKRLSIIQKNFAVTTCYINKGNLTVLSETKTKVAKFPVKLENFDLSLKFPLILLDFPYQENVQISLHKLPQDRFWVKATDGVSTICTSAILENFTQ